MCDFQIIELKFKIHKPDEVIVDQMCHKISCDTVSTSNIIECLYDIDMMEISDQITRSFTSDFDQVSQ